MAFSEAKVEEVVGAVRRLAAQPFVAALEDHFAGYWNELGIFVTLTDDALDSEVITLRNALLGYLGGALPQGNKHFIWQVSFKRRGKTVEVLFPGDRERETTDELVPL